MAQQYSLRTANFAGGKAFRILIPLKGYAHCIYLLLTVSLIMIPLENDTLYKAFLSSLILAGRERVKSLPSKFTANETTFVNLQYICIVTDSSAPILHASFLTPLPGNLKLSFENLLMRQRRYLMYLLMNRTVSQFFVIIAEGEQIIWRYEQKQKTYNIQLKRIDTDKMQ